MEIVTLSIAKEFGLLPNEVEERISKRWWDLLQVIEEEKQRGK